MSLFANQLKCPPPRFCPPALMLLRRPWLLFNFGWRGFRYYIDEGVIRMLRTILNKKDKPGATEVKHGCVRSETGWVTFQMNDQNSSLSHPSEGTLN